MCDLPQGKPGFGGFGGRPAHPAARCVCVCKTQVFTSVSVREDQATCDSVSKARSCRPCQAKSCSRNAGCFPTLFNLRKQPPTGWLTQGICLTYETCRLHRRHAPQPATAQVSIRGRQRLRPLVRQLRGRPGCLEHCQDVLHSASERGGEAALRGALRDGSSWRRI